MTDNRPEEKPGAAGEPHYVDLDFSPFINRIITLYQEGPSALTHERIAGVLQDVLQAFADQLPRGTIQVVHSGKRGEG